MRSLKNTFFMKIFIYKTYLTTSIMNMILGVFLGVCKKAGLKKNNDYKCLIHQFNVFYINRVYFVLFSFLRYGHFFDIPTFIFGDPGKNFIGKSRWNAAAISAPLEIYESANFSITCFK